MKTTFGSIFLVLICVLGLFGCGKSKAEKEGEQVSLAQEQAKDKLLGLLKATLKDSDSAKFQNVKIGMATYDLAKTKSDYAICGEVNSKNGFGGYVGFQRFAVASNLNGIPTVYMGEMLESIVDQYAKQLGCTPK